MIRRLALAVALAVAAAPHAAAQSPAVDAARAAGVVGERFDGFLDYASPPSMGVRAQTDAINIKRRTLYTRLAARRGVAASEVGITAGCQLLQGVAVGEPYLLSDGVWRRRRPGEGAPVPSYCR